ncbi:MAG: hypothetical protein FJX66_05080 [Alphaproteobacteria bacterium]|nr:hypothetical protein [Alphaproteobacteria bacterium]
MFLEKLFGRSPLKDQAHDLYVAAVRQARQEPFYAACGVPDTLDGRFDLIVLHVFLLLRGLKKGGEAGQRLGQAVLEVMFDDMDQNLREMGVGDLSVGKKVKAMARAFYGRSQAYGDALEPGAAADALEQALDRNVYGRQAPRPPQLAALAAYVRAAADIALKAPYETVSAEGIPYPPAPTPS